MSGALSASDGAMPGMVRRADAGPARSAADALRRHWPEYLMEAAGLGLFMISAGVFATLLWYPGSPLAQAVPDGILRRALMGLAMGLTATLIIYSPWGQRSGAHINPAVTLTFWRLGKVATWDAIFYVAAQFAGGLLGVLALARLLGAAFAEPPVSYVATMPGPGGVTAALVAEVVISFGLMAIVLLATNTPRLMRFTGLFAGLLVATYITFEAPLSGMSMNPARTLASALPGGLWHALWIYFVGPVVRHAAGGRGLPPDPAHARGDLRQAEPPHPSALHLLLRLRRERPPGHAG